MMRRRRKDTPLTAEELREVLNYDPETGVFRWNVRTANQVKIGCVAGGLDREGYIQISVKKNIHSAHRLAWLHVNGSFPRHNLDHINGVRNDNRISNLREASTRENACNRKLHRDGRLPGTHKRKSNKWSARIQIGKQPKHLGYFSSEEAAHHTYLIWKHNLGL